MTSLATAGTRTTGCTRPAQSADSVTVRDTSVSSAPDDVKWSRPGTSWARSGYDAIRKGPIEPHVTFVPDWR